MQLNGAWIDESDYLRPGLLWAWGEWEAQSKKLRNLPKSTNAVLPRRLWEPYYQPPNEYQELHNTDPFIFGDRFLYSNCQQWGTSRNGLRLLDWGSVIAFGSRLNHEWVLDTVLVVKDFVDYEARAARSILADCAPETFLDVSGRPIEHGDCGLRLYRGATPSDRVNGMYSFFPAAPAGGDTGFPRPIITLPDEYFGKKVQYAKGHKLDDPDVGSDKLRELWDCLVRQVRHAGLVLGTRAELPERREG